MNKIKQLEVRKLLKELDFVESDFNYKNEIISEADTTFIRNVNQFLEKHPTLKEAFDKNFNTKIENLFNKKMELIESSIQEEFNESKIEELIEEVEIVIDPKLVKLKKLYREIVKLTHPDRIQNKKLNEIYLRATHFYSLKDVSGTYSICDELDIFYEADEEDEMMIVDKINKLKDRINFMESTLTWKWHHSEDNTERDQIVLKYIKTQLQ